MLVPAPLCVRSAREYPVEVSRPETVTLETVKHDVDFEPEPEPDLDYEKGVLEGVPEGIPPS